MKVNPSGVAGIIRTRVPGARPGLLDDDTSGVGKAELNKPELIQADEVLTCDN